jgi:hypothetical protein
MLTATTSFATLVPRACHHFTTIYLDASALAFVWEVFYSVIVFISMRSLILREIPISCSL